GVTIMQMDEGLDTGDMLLMNKVDIEPTHTTPHLHDKLAALGATSIIEALKHMFDDGLTATPQPDEGVTYAKKIDKAEARINWSLAASDIDRMVRALNPFPGAWFELDGQRIKIVDGHPQGGEGVAGHALNDTFLIACGEGAYQVTRAQRAGKGVMKADEFLRGVAITEGTDLNGTPS
ncbi:MAG: methionyl-tRNA formyltransferase, partial [Sphingomonadales bacterium]|nr:methionyl-tRNA formyltransferase [Sphingomonadales bacterium]